MTMNKVTFTEHTFCMVTGKRLMWHEYTPKNKSLRYSEVVTIYSLQQSFLKGLLTRKKSKIVKRSNKAKMNCSVMLP